MTDVTSEENLENLENLELDDLDAQIDGGALSLSDLKAKLAAVKQKVQEGVGKFSQKTQQIAANIDKYSTNLSNKAQQISSTIDQHVSNLGTTGSPRPTRPVPPVPQPAFTQGQSSDRQVVVQTCINRCEAFTRELSSVEQNKYVSSAGLTYNDVSDSIQTLLSVADTFLNNDEDINRLRKRCGEQSSSLRQMLDTFKPPMVNATQTYVAPATSRVDKVSGIFGNGESVIYGGCHETYSKVAFVLLAVLILVLMYFTFLSEHLVTNSPQLLSSEIEQREDVTFSEILKLPYGMF